MQCSWTQTTFDDGRFRIQLHGARIKDKARATVVETDAERLALVAPQFYREVIAAFEKAGARPWTFQDFGIDPDVKLGCFTGRNATLTRDVTVEVVWRNAGPYLSWVVVPPWLILLLVPHGLTDAQRFSFENRQAKIAKELGACGSLLRPPPTRLKTTIAETLERDRDGKRAPEIATRALRRMQAEHFLDLLMRGSRDAALGRSA